MRILGVRKGKTDAKLYEAKLVRKSRPRYDIVLVEEDVPFGERRRECEKGERRVYLVLCVRRSEGTGIDRVYWGRGARRRRK
jgi:hypothetical protein